MVRDAYEWNAVFRTGGPDPDSPGLHMLFFAAAGKEQILFPLG
jgi:hypothetical protein